MPQTRWLQSWIQMGPRLPTHAFPYSLFWWKITGPPLPVLPPNYYSSTLQTWWHDSGRLLSNNVPTGFSSWYYWQDGANFGSGEWFAEGAWTPPSDAPYGVSMVVRRFTAGSGRSSQGRSFFPVPALSILDGNDRIDESWRIAWRPALDALISTMPTSFGLGDFIPCLPSWKNGSLEPIVAMTINSRLGYCRKRGRARKANPPGSGFKSPP